MSELRPQGRNEIKQLLADHGLRPQRRLGQHFLSDPNIVERIVIEAEIEPGDKVLIAESCSHHALEDDIGRVKIPRWLRQYVGVDVEIDVYAGRDFPDNLSEYKLAVQCGGCMQNRREVLSRIEKCEAAGVPITNYGMCIAQTQGVLKRVLSPFPSALLAYEEVIKPPRRQERQGVQL